MTTKSGMWRLLLVVGLMPALSGICCASEPPTKEVILAALAHQNSATVEYACNMKIVNSAWTKTDRKADDNPKNNYFPIRYIRTPEMLYEKEANGQTCSSERVGITGIADYRAASVQRRFDQETGTPIGTISHKNATGLWAGFGRLETVLFGMFARDSKGDATCFLYGWITYGKVGNRTETIDGHECWKVDITDTGKSMIKHYEIWLDPSIGFNPRRIAMYGDDSYNGKWDAVTNFNNYKEIAEGIWFPQKEVCIKNVPKKGIVDERLTFTASDLRGDKKYSKDDLRVTFAPGTDMLEQTANGHWNKTKQK